jgi:secreted trypsin-like serine protease
MYLLICCIGAASAAPDSRIVNGENAVYGEHPYICSLQLRQGGSWYHICGCVLYNTRCVITAAHCVDGTK